jgi:hypothetical protein
MKRLTSLMVALMMASRLAVAAPPLAGITASTAAAAPQRGDARFTIRLPIALAPSTAAGWLQPTERITPAAGCVLLTPGMNGVKVKLVQRRLGMPATTWETMDATTIAKVTAFQTANGLTADGVVGPVTWRALGFAEDFCFDRFQMQPQLPLAATPEQRIETFVTAARSYLGDEYVWGGAGPKGYGMDCSGLVLQALYAAGLDPQPISVDKHVLPEYRTSVELFNHPHLRHRPLAQVQRGDLVFYTNNSTGRINHVAIYLGSGQVLEAAGGNVHVSALTHTRSTQTIVPEVVRPFATVQR